MPKQTKELTALETKRLTEPGRHPVGTVPGLYLWVRESGTKNWVLRVVVKGKRADIGLGGYPAITLADAIKRAREIRESIANGGDPLAEKRAARAEEMTFQRAAIEYITLHRPGWKNAKHAQQWENTLATYVYPTIGNMPVKNVDTPHVLEILRPHWNTKNETMVRVRNRIELVLAWAMASGHRERGLNPAAWRGHLDHALPKPSKVNNRQHHAALPWQDVPLFMNKLALLEGMSARCLEFTILTACRSGESRGARWDEIDIANKVWNIPPERMKAGRPHRVPLSDRAVKLLKALPIVEGEKLVFVGAKENTPLSDMSLTMLLRRHAHGVTAHGFRSTFRDWAAETTHYPREVCEMALAHAVGDAVEVAYRRGDLFAKRAALMQDWASYASIASTRNRGSCIAKGCLMNVRRPAGRPTQAAQTLEEALIRAYAGELPKRPRNDIEREVMRRQKGRKKDQNTPSHGAAQYALQLVQDDGLPEREASRKAGEAFNLHPDTVRRALRQLRTGPTVKITVPVPQAYKQLVPETTAIVPLVPAPEDLPEAWRSDIP